MENIKKIKKNYDVKENANFHDNGMAKEGSLIQLVCQ